MSHDQAGAPEPITVMLYSDDRTVREQVRLALGRRVARDLPELVIEECATHPALRRAVDAGGIDLMILDGEATPAGGMGVCHELKDQIKDCPPAVLLVARVADSWLAAWSGAEALTSYPVDPIRLPGVVADVIRRHVLPQAATA